MKKNYKMYLAAWAIVLALFNLIVFVIPKEIAGVNRYDDSFWVGYAFITVLLFGQLVTAYFAFKTTSRERLFLNIPLVTISYSTLIIMLIVGGAAMMIPAFPSWIGIILCAIVLAFGALAVIRAYVAAEIVTTVSQKVDAKTSFIRALTMEADALKAVAKTKESQEIAKKVHEALRYSDPMSFHKLDEIESRIEEQFALLKDAIANNNENAETIKERLLSLIAERNVQCKAMK